MPRDRVLPASPNWYCSRCSDTNGRGTLGFGARNTIYLIDVASPSCRVVGELVGHRERVSGFSFSQHAGQSQLCVSCSDDGTIKFWDADDKVLLKEHSPHQNTMTAVQWSPVDKNLVVSGDEKGIVVCHWYHTGDTLSFFPEPRTIFCLSCSPHTWNLVAVGYKDGMIVLMDISKKGEVLHRLRGHDDEIHALSWSPSANEERLYVARPDDVTATNGELNGEEKREETGGFLASGSKDQTIRIWSTARGKGVMTLKLPFLKRRGSVDPTVKERLWLSVHWPKGRPTQLLSTCFSGELVLWDLTKTGKQKWTLLGSSSEGQNHTRIVFNMSSVCLQDGRELLFSTSMDREVKCWDLSSLDCLWTLPTLGGFVYALTFSSVATGCLALGVGDNMIRVWSTMSLQNVYETRTFWQGIKSKVTALAWHPKKEGSLAFGTDDGKVGIYDAFANKSPQVSSSYHRKTVYSLAWGPPVPPMSFGGSADRPSHTLYSCAGEGNILQHDPWNLGGDAAEVDKLIKDTNGIKHKLSAHTDISWKPDNRVVAIGNEDGSIDVYEAPSLKQLCSIQQHHKIINCLRWHGDHGPQPQHHFLLASGSTNAVIYVHDLRSVIEKPPASAVVITEAYRSLSGHTAKVTGLAWSPHHEARLVTVCYDGTAQVWDVQQETGLCNYRDHRGRLLCVDWSPVDPDVVWTGADDFTVQEWRVSQQEFTAPPKGNKIANLRDKQKPKSKAKKKKSGVSGTGGGGSVPSPCPSVNGDSTVKGGRGAESSLPARQEPSDEDDEEEKRSILPLPVSLPASADTVRKSSTTSKTKERPDVVTSLKKRRLRSMLPLSTSMDHRPRDLQLQDCLTLAALTHTHTPPGGCVPGQGEYIHLGLFTDRQALYRMLQEEEEGHAEAAHYDSIPYLRLWSGDLQGALQLATERGELSDHLLSLAPMAGYQVWSRTVEAYVKQLCLQEQHLKAASHLLSINRVYPAIDLLQCNKLYREAIALAKARLQPDDPVLKELFLSWAAILEKDGHLSSAAKCYLAAGAGFDAAKVLSRKSDALSLETAAGVASLSGEAGLAASLCLRLAKDLAADDDWLAAQRALNTQDALLVHRLYFSVTELLTLTLSDCRVLPWSCTSAHPWSQSCEPPGTARGLRHRIREVWAKEFRVSEELTDKETLRRLLQELKAVENPQHSPNLPLKQVVCCVSLYVSQAVVSLLLCDCIEEVTALWQAVSGTSEHFSLCSAICTLLFPDGPASLGCLPEDQEESAAASVSLQAVICYHSLYETWWTAAGTHRNQPSAVSAYGNNQALTDSNLTSYQPLADSASANNQALTDSNSNSHQPLADSASANNQASTDSNLTSHQLLVDSASANNQASTDSNLTSHQLLVDSASANNQASTDSNLTSHQPLADSASANNQALTDSNSNNHQPLADSASANNQASTDSNLTSHQPMADSASANNQALTDSNSNNHQPLGDSGSANNQASTCENRINQSEVSTPNVDRSERVSPDAPLSESDVCVSTKSIEGRDWMEVCPMLLSESHAAYQATQRAVTDIQDRLSFMVTRHSAAPLVTQPPPAIMDASSTEQPSDGARIPTDQESLLSLSSKMTEYKRELEQLPSTVKTFPRPDVMECCLVLLHLSGTSSMVPPALQEKAKELLRRYATTPSLHTASHRFLT